MKDIVIAGPARTPIGKFGGAFAGVPATELGAKSIEASLERAAVDPGDVDYTVMGNVLSAGVGQAPARQAAIGAGIPDSASALTINKVCASGMQAIILAAQAVQCGDAEGVAAIELNVSCPNTEEGGMIFGNDRICLVIHSPTSVAPATSVASGCRA